MRTCGSLFSSGGGFELGSGLRSAWAIEEDPRIAAVHHANVGPVMGLAMRAINPTKLEKVDVLFVGARRTAAHDAILPAFAKAIEPKAILIETIGPFSAALRKADAGWKLEGFTAQAQMIDGAQMGLSVERKRAWAVYTKGRAFAWPKTAGRPSWMKPLGTLPLPLAPALDAKAAAELKPAKWPVAMGRSKTVFLEQNVPLPENCLGLRVVEEGGKAYAITREAAARLIGLPPNYRLPVDEFTARTILRGTTSPVMAKAMVAALA
jgi:hypothetical protein